MPTKVKNHKPKNSIQAAAKLLGKQGGLVGGKARAKKLSPARRKAIAAKGGRARAAKGR